MKWGFTFTVTKIQTRVFCFFYLFKGNGHDNSTSSYQLVKEIQQELWEFKKISGPYIKEHVFILFFSKFYFASSARAKTEEIIKIKKDTTPWWEPYPLESWYYINWVSWAVRFDWSFEVKFEMQTERTETKEEREERKEKKIDIRRCYV